MFIQIEETPNPATLKFLPGEVVLPRGRAEFTLGNEARSPLAARIFSLGGIERVFYGYDFISVTKAENRDWTLLKPRILGAVMDHFTSGAPLLLDQSSSEADTTPDDTLDDELTRQIKELLDTRIRPSVAMDGGDITFEKFENGILYLRLQGACAGCPSSTITLKDGIENMMRHFVPEVEEVRAVE